MIIDINSWHYRMNTYLSEELKYVYEPEEYNNLCPYFWYTVYNILVLIVFLIKRVLYKTIPNTPPILITDGEAYSVTYNWKPFSSIFLMSVTIISVGVSLGFVAFLFLLNLPTEIFLLFKYGWDMLPFLLQNSFPLGMACFLIAIFVFGFSLYSGVNWFENRKYKEKDSVIKRVVVNKLESSITYNMIKSKKEKYCPRIEFKDLSNIDE